MRIHFLPSLGCAALTLLGASCSSFTENDRVCTAEFRYGLTVTVLDSATGAVDFSGARGTIQDGDYTDSLTAVGDAANIRALVGAGERQGTYTVRVTKPGYEPWVKHNVQVTHDGCHVRGVPLDARMVRLTVMD